MEYEFELDGGYVIPKDLSIQQYEQRATVFDFTKNRYAEDRDFALLKASALVEKSSGAVDKIGLQTVYDDEVITARLCLDDLHTSTTGPLGIQIEYADEAGEYRYLSYVLTCTVQRSIDQDYIVRTYPTQLQQLDQRVKAAEQAALQVPEQCVELIAQASEAADRAEAAAGQIEGAGGVIDQAEQAAADAREATETLLQRAADGNFDGVAAVWRNVKQFGALGDGVTDDTNAIQQGVEALSVSGGTLFFPSGIYKVGGTVTIRHSNIHIVGDADTRILVVNTEGRPIRVGSVFKVLGSVEETERIFAEDVPMGGRIVPLSNIEGLQSHDDVLLIAPMICTSLNTPEKYRLGYITQGAADIQFGEMQFVSRVIPSYITPDGRTCAGVELRAGLLWPFYTTTGEANPAVPERPPFPQRVSASLQKINFVQNVSIENLQFFGEDLKSSRREAHIQFTWAKNCRAVNCPSVFAASGTAINFLWCRNVDAINCNTEFTAPKLDPSQHSQRNAYKATSSQNCSFDNCGALNGSQPWDFTAENGGMPTMFCDIIKCRSIASQYSGYTFHGCTYGCRIKDCQSTHTGREGIFIRGRGHTISGNLLVGSTNYSFSERGRGIALGSGGGQDSIIENNTIINFDSAIELSESVQYVRDEDGNFVVEDGNRKVLRNCSYTNLMNVTIRNNMISGCTNALRIIRHYDSVAKDLNMALDFSGNHIFNFYAPIHAPVEEVFMLGADYIEGQRVKYLYTNSESGQRWHVVEAVCDLPDCQDEPFRGNGSKVWRRCPVDNMSMPILFNGHSTADAESPPISGIRITGNTFDGVTAVSGGTMQPACILYANVECRDLRIEDNICTGFSREITVPRLNIDGSTSEVRTGFYAVRSAGLPVTATYKGNLVRLADGSDAPILHKDDVTTKLDTGEADRTPPIRYLSGVLLQPADWLADGDGMKYCIALPSSILPGSYTHAQIMPSLGSMAAWQAAGITGAEADPESGVVWIYAPSRPVSTLDVDITVIKAEVVR